MRSPGIRALALGTAFAFSLGCASSTLIKSTPPGAKVYLNGELAGNTPYTMTDTKIVGSTTTVRLKLEGYESFTVSISRNEEFDVGPCIGGVLVLVPFLWIMKYKPEHNYELVPRPQTHTSSAALPWQARLATRSPVACPADGS